MISVKVGKKKLERRLLRGERLYLQFDDGTWKWREYTPFFLSGDGTDKVFQKRANELAVQRAREYQEMEDMVSELQNKE